MDSWAQGPGHGPPWGPGPSVSRETLRKNNTQKKLPSGPRKKILQTFPKHGPLKIGRAQGPKWALGPRGPGPKQALGPNGPWPQWALGPMDPVPIYIYIYNNGLGPFGTRPFLASGLFFQLFTWFAACHHLKAPAWRWPSALSLKKHHGFITFAINPHFLFVTFSLVLSVRSPPD